jgi:hypothetical protein
MTTDLARPTPPGTGKSGSSGLARGNQLKESRSFFRRGLSVKHRHREERNDVAIQKPSGKTGWPRFARYDEG